jgi:hypothetical protein
MELPHTQGGPFRALAALVVRLAVLFWWFEEGEEGEDRKTAPLGARPSSPGGTPRPRS